ncbi:MAG TPA: hemerythrin domain-containing protein [candidate division Zixibacteria bacterium]|nr:hemerythrin domain-containing protein [candidate division Zixibacteria bacterium]
MRHPSLIPLSHDHHHGLALALRCRKQALGQIRPAGAEGVRQRVREAREFYERNLVPHFCAEEKVLFPWLRARAADSGALIDRLVAEHRRLAAAFEALEETGDAARRLFDLGDLLERHIRAEERQLFPLYEKNVRGEEGDRIGGEIERALERGAKVSP